jgi:archaellum component FlaC
MQLDGGFSDITMICSKTDHISVTEALKSLPIEDSSEAHEISDQLGHLNRSLLRQRVEVEAMKKRVAELHDLVEEHDKEIEMLEAAVKHAADDRVSFPGTPKKKRKRRTTASASRKRTEAHLDDDDDWNSYSSSGDELAVSDTDEQLAQNLSLDEAREKLEELKEQKRKLREERDGLAQHMKPARREEKRLKHQIKELTSQRKRLCIQYRNNYSRPTIQGQFAAGIRE